MDRPSSGVVGSTNDLATLAVAWLRPDGIAKETRDRLIATYAPQLDGFVPGFGQVLTLSLGARSGDPG